MQRELTHLREEREFLRHRARRLDEIREELKRSQRALEELRLEINVQAREGARELAEVRRQAEEARIERRVPLSAVHYDLEESPRPIRGLARLAINIKRFGQLSPVTARALGGGRYALISGYRRMEALSLARCTHVLLRVVEMDEETASALQIAENCMVEGIPSNAVRHLAERLSERPGFQTVLPLILSDDQAAEEEMYLEEMADEARHHLAEGAGWISALRPHWEELEEEQRLALEAMIFYFAQISALLR